MVKDSVGDLTNGLAVIPAAEVHPLSDKLNGRLGAVHFPGWHVEVVNEEDEVLAKGRAEHTLSPVMLTRHSALKLSS